MSKTEFLNELESKLKGLPKKDIKERLSFYSEMIDDRMDEGVLEVDAVLELGDIDDIADQIFDETPLSKIVKERIRPKKKLLSWQIVLIILGAPLWLPLLLGAGGLVIGLLAAAGAILLAFWICAGALAICFVAMVVASFVSFLYEGFASAISILGCALFAGGLAIILYLIGKKLTKKSFESAKIATSQIKNQLIVKEYVNEEVE